MTAAGKKYMDVAEFRRLGYLQELNRRLLHPLGLALEVVVAADGTETLGQIWDHRDDPEGIHFGPGTIDSTLAHRIGHELMARGTLRRDRLGYVIQRADSIDARSQGDRPVYGGRGRSDLWSGRAVDPRP